MREGRLPDSGPQRVSWALAAAVFLTAWSVLAAPWLSGAVVRLGRDAGVPTPIHQFIATVLKPHTDGLILNPLIPDP